MSNNKVITSTLGFRVPRKIAPPLGYTAVMLLVITHDSKVNFSAIPGYLFRTPESVYESKSNPKNHCYCSPNLPEGWCTERDGIRMFDQCQFGAPGKIDLQMTFKLIFELI